MKPPFRWVGGKARILPYMLPYLPGHTHSSTRVKRYFEPMMGGGACFWQYGSMYAERCFLNDINYPLMNAYACLRSFYDDVRTEALKLDHLSYNELRQRYNQLKQLDATGWYAELAAMFCMLMSTCFNGVYRENRSGGFNCPQGKDSKGNRHQWSRVDWEGLEKAGKVLHQANAGITSCSIFERPYAPNLAGAEHWFMQGAGSPPGLGDVVIYDPPFAGEFSDYHASRFGLEQHEALRDQAQDWADNGATVIVCGSNNQWSWSIYGRPTVVIPVKRALGNSLRGDATEALYVMQAST